jgi:phosphoribosylformylglycinamidine cyclo-ligase
MSELSAHYAESGVDTDGEEEGMKRLGEWVTRSFGLRPGLGRPVLPLGHYANVIALTDRLGLALSADGVGTKIFIAEMMDRYDSVGIDCVAMNVNDLVCIGAEPLAMLDYIAVQAPHPRLLEEIGKGLYRACEMARITVPGGEVAQVREMIRGHRDGWSFDLVGAAVGVVDLDRILTGSACRPGDVVIGIASTGLHSNGFTLARRVLLKEAGLDVHATIPALGSKTLGDVLLEPTAIYVREAVAMQKAKLPVRGFAHITSDGLTNLLRLEAEVGFELDFLPEPQPIFRQIQERGKIGAAEMYEVFNMGVGFCVVCASEARDEVLACARSDGKQAWVLGRATPGPREVHLRPAGLVGRGNHFSEARRT